MLAADEIDELRAGVILLDDAIANIRAVEARDEDARSRELEPLEDLGARVRVGGRGERDARHGGKTRLQHGKLQVFRAEIVPPLRNAVRFVDREEREPARREELQ